MDEHYTHSELERKFPRIAERVSQLWKKAELGEYLDEIMIDDRGNRHGFPEDVALEILFLRRLHDFYMQNSASTPDSRNVWSNPLYTKTTGHDGAD